MTEKCKQAHGAVSAYLGVSHVSDKDVQLDFSAKTLQQVSKVEFLYLPTNCIAIRDRTESSWFRASNKSMRTASSFHHNHF